jgi:hypothetical protein
MRASGPSAASARSTPALGDVTGSTSSSRKTASGRPSE